MAKDILIVVCSLILTGVFVMLFIKSVKAMFDSIINEPTNRHYESDYWDDTGDGSGVNYVQMPDGSVRID